MSTSASPRKRARSGSSGETSTATSSSSRPRPAVPASASADAGPSGAAGRRAVRRRYDERSTDEDDEEREPSTVDNSSADEGPARRANGSAAIPARPSDPRLVKNAIQGRAAADEDEEEPDTEPSGDEAAVAGPSGAGRRSASADPAAVLDLTDEGDDAGGAAGLSDSAAAALPLDRRQGESLFSTRLGDGPVSLGGDGDEDDDVLVALPHSTVPAPSSSDPKGKRKASSPPPPAADALPSLSHLTCPICFGSPAPLALTSCGHAFCAPCLHAALVAGPALTPPPAGGAAGRGRGGAAARGRAALAAAGLRGRGGSRGGARGGSAAARRGGAPDSDDDGDPDLNKHCPVCRTPLYGGWGKSLRGVVLRMAPVKR